MHVINNKSLFNIIQLAFIILQYKVLVVEVDRKLKFKFSGRPHAKVAPTIYYINDEKLQAVLINLDWYAFDSVTIEFVLKILKKYGINDNYVNWVN